MKDWIATILLLSGISTLYLLGEILIESALPATYPGNSFAIISLLGKISASLTPIMLYVFISLTSYLMILVFKEEVKISHLLSKMWISFIPILISSMISYFVLQGILNYDLNELKESEVLALELRLNLTLSDLKMISNISYFLLYSILSLIIRDVFELEFIPSVISSFVPSLLVFLLGIIFRM